LRGRHGEPGRETILVVDDNAELASTLTQFFEERGHPVIVALTGLEGRRARWGNRGPRSSPRLTSQIRLFEKFYRAENGRGPRRHFLFRPARSGVDAMTLSPKRILLVEAAAISSRQNLSLDELGHLVAELRED
jgi:hypothetical protein